ncbi:endonuclease/exonuclease/phosphatase family protein [Streptomyces sp. NPDC056716]|uniref:endonuclease/exonuclease/phosphatase family protein n=1 Tax=unclassified Streptomyces TaxID=2593676 RepID=UPI00367CA550
METFTVISFNLELDGGPDEHGRPSQRWHDAHEALAAHDPAILLRQEATRSRADGHARLHLAERALGGMRGFLAPAGVGQHPTAIFVRPDVLTVTHQYELTDWRTPPTNIIATLDGAPRVPIILMSWHNTPTSPRQREREADDISRLVGVGRHGGWIGGGDCNEYPAPDGETVPQIDWTTVRDLPHIQYRTNPGPDGTLESCTYLDRKLLGCGLHDVARYAAHTLGQREALSHTAGWAPGTEDQGGYSRLDRIYGDPYLVQAVIKVEVLDIDGSDHKAVKAVFHHGRAIDALHRKVAPLAPLKLTAPGRPRRAGHDCAIG